MFTLPLILPIILQTQYNIKLNKLVGILICSYIIALVSCNIEESKNKELFDDTYLLNVPKGFPNQIIPADNKLTKSRIELGKRLFYDKLLSIDGEISCASCHLPAFSFSDTTAFSTGVAHHATKRNSTQLANVGYQKGLFSEGGVSSLELQVLAPSNEFNEMNKSLSLVVKELLQDNSYIEMFDKAYQSMPNAKYIAYAISAFERTLVSGNSRFDKYFYQGNLSALSKSEKNGYKIFSSDSINCISCHSGFLFSDQKFYNIGLNETDYDEGRARLTFDKNDMGKFKTPSLRNISVTAPYMHDGSLQTIEQVIDHYIEGGRNNTNKSKSIKKIKMTVDQKNDLKNFLLSLTDNSFVSNKSFQ
jgi:cytochrome c peroxidase